MNLPADLKKIPFRWVQFLGLLGIVLILLHESRGRGDFYIYLTASLDLFKGKDIYEVIYSSEFHYYYGVFFAIIIYPLCFIPLFLAKFLWLLVNLVLVFRIWKIFSYYLGTAVFSVNRRRILALISFIFILRFLRDNFHLAQMTICILYLCMEGIYQADHRRELAGSILIALGIDIKILPIVLIPWFLYRGRFKMLLFTTVFALMFILLPSLLIGYAHNKFLVKERWKLINPMNPTHTLDVEEDSFHSLTTLCSVLLVKDARNNNSLDIKRNIMDISLPELKVVIDAVRTFFILLALYFIGAWPFRKVKSRIQEFYELSYILLAAPLILPHQQHYAFFMAFPATTYLICYMMMKYYPVQGAQSPPGSFKRNKVILFTLMVIIYLVLNSHFIFGQFNRLYDHFKILTYGVLLLVGVLACCRPGKISIIPEGH